LTGKTAFLLSPQKNWTVQRVVDNDRKEIRALLTFPSSAIVSKHQTNFGKSSLG